MHLAKCVVHKVQEVVKRFKFTVDGKEIKTVSEFRYLGSVVKDDDTDGATILGSITRARGKWSRSGRLLTRVGANPMAMGLLYNIIVQTVLLYGSESWVISKDQMRQLWSFHLDGHDILHRDTFGRRQMSPGLSHQVRRFWRKLVYFQSRITFKNARIQSDRKSVV